MRRHPYMIATRDDWTWGEWIVVILGMAVINIGIVALATTFGSIIRWP